MALIGCGVNDGVSMACPPFMEMVVSGGTSASARFGRNREIESRVNLPCEVVVCVVVDWWWWWCWQGPVSGF